jgi:hypothetical protein
LGLASISSAIASFNASRTVISFVPAGLAYPLLLDNHDGAAGAINRCALLKDVDDRGADN